MRELDVQAKFRKRVKSEIPDAFYYKIPDAKGLGNRKPFDAILLCNNVFFAIEFKSEKGHTTPFQDYNLRLVADNKGNGVVIRPSNFEQRFRLIKEMVAEASCLKIIQEKEQSTQ